jgi:hemolysin activation/secretion protein
MKKLITLSIITTSYLMGASPIVPSSSDIQREVTPPKVPVQITPLVEIKGIQKYAPPMQEDKSIKTIFVQSFKITGAMNISESKLQTIIAKYTNKELTFKQLQEVASLITKAYREEGYFVARAYIPIQNMQDGVVEITVIEGEYGKFILENNSRVKDFLAQAMLNDAKNRGNVVSTNTLERSMLIINDTPGVKVVQADIMPGAEVGTSDFAIKTESTSWYDGYVLADNNGSRYTGKNRVMAGVNFNSLAGLGDKLSFSGLISNGSDLKNRRISYSIPLMANGLRTDISYSKTNYNLVDLDGTADNVYYGTSNTLDATLSYPIIRTRLETLKISSTIASKDLTDYISGNAYQEKEAKSINLALNYSKDQRIFGLNSQITSGLTYTYGDLKFLDEASKTTDSAGANTQGKYSKINGYLSASALLPQELTLQASLQFQKALGNKNLDGSEDMSIGGSNGVKVYPDGELSAENAILFNIELTKTLPSLGAYSHKLGLFYDIGKASMEDDSKDTTFKSRTLQDVGIGYYANYKTFFAKAQVATIVGGEDVKSEPNDNTRVLVQIGLVF